MTSLKRTNPPTSHRSLKSGKVVRIHSHNRHSEIGDDGATTPDVNLTVNFEDRFLHQAEQSPEGSLEGSVRLKFAPAPPPDQPDVAETGIAETGIVVPRRKQQDRSNAASVRPAAAVAPPPKFPERKAPRVQKRPIKRPKGDRRRMLPLAMAGVVAAGVMIPSQIDNAQGNWDSLAPPAEPITKNAALQENAPQPKATETAQTKTAQIIPATQPASEPLVAMEHRVAVNSEPKLQGDASNPAVVLPKDPVAETEYSAALKELDRLKTERLPAPKPQKLASPSAAGKLDFVFSKPVGTPPDPNEMAVVPDNPFVDLLIVEKGAQVATAEPALPIAPFWAAAALTVGPQTDQPAVASPIAPPPPAKPGPNVLAKAPELPLARLQQNHAKLPVLSDGPTFAWSAAAALETPGKGELPYTRPVQVVNSQLVAAVAIQRPDEPKELGSEIVNPPAPPEAQNADLRQRFIKPPKEYLNSDTAVDAEIAKPATPPPPRLGVGDLKVLSQFWQTQLNLEFDDQSGIVRIAKDQASDLDWLVPGQQVSALNGQDIQFRADYLTEIKQLCEGVTSGKADLSLTVDGQEKTLPVSCLRRTALSNGLVLEAKFKRRKWKIFVVEEAINNLSDLRTGDQLVVDYSSDTSLNTPQAVRETISAAVERAAKSIELGIIRDGAIETAFMQITDPDK